MTERYDTGVTVTPDDTCVESNSLSSHDYTLSCVYRMDIFIYCLLGTAQISSGHWGMTLSMGN